MNNKNKIGALAVKCEEQKERILELESELRRAKYNQEINDVTKNRLSMAIKYLEGQVEILRCCLQSVTNNMVRTGNTNPEGSGEMNGDLISRNALLKKKWDADTRCEYVQVVDVGDILKASTVVATPMVRCKECRYWERHNNTSLGNCYHGIYAGSNPRTSENYFCARAARMDGREGELDDVNRYFCKR